MGLSWPQLLLRRCAPSGSNLGVKRFMSPDSSVSTIWPAVQMPSFMKALQKTEESVKCLVVSSSSKLTEMPLTHLSARCLPGLLLTHLTILRRRTLAAGSAVPGPL